MCKTLEVSRSTYYKFLEKTLSNRIKENRKYKEEILTIYKESGKCYGAPKIQKML